MLKLLIIYHLVPEQVISMVVLPHDPRYQYLKDANGCYINNNDDQYPDNVSDEVVLMSEIDTSDINRTADTFDVISGDFKIIHCGFYL